MGDFNGDGYSDILWRQDGGVVGIWFMQHAMLVGTVFPGAPGNEWQIQGIGDFDRDRRDDILWRRNTDALLALWQQGQYDTGLRPSWQNQPGSLPSYDWIVDGVSDFNADGLADILWRHKDGAVVIWKMNGGTYLGESAHAPMDTTYQLRGLLAQGHQRLTLN